MRNFLQKRDIYFMLMFLLTIILAAIGYLVGSLNSAILVCKSLQLGDPRTEGSGNPGATNVLRIAGKMPALIVLLGDILKGLLPVLIAKVIDIDGFELALIALACVIGHIFPLFFNFQGGKGVATAFGSLLILSASVAIVVAIVWGVVVFTTKYISLASLIAGILSTVLILFAHTAYFLPLFVITTLIIFRHKDNINRLKLGTESKFNLQKNETS